MKDIKLLQIVPSLESGGTEQGAIDVANFVADNGYKSFITSNGGKMLGLLNKKNTTHINLPVQSKNPLVMLRNIKKIENIIKKNQINLIHVRSRAPSWSLYYASKDGCKTVSTFHNVYGHQNIFKRFYNKGLSKVDRIVAISKFVKDSIISLYGINEKNISVIYRGIDTEFFDPSLSDEKKFMEFYSKYNLPDDKKIILYPGRLTSWKGQIEFLNILQSLDPNQIKCYFIGDDKNKSYAQKIENEIIKKNLASVCKIFGSLSREDLRFMYTIADLVISAPLKPEGFGRIISEGLAMKKIVLCYNYGGVKDQISGLDNLFSVKPHDHLEMVEKIKISLALTNDKINKIGEVSRNHVTKKFSKNIMLNNYLQMYKEII